MFIQVAEFHRVFKQHIANSPSLPDQNIRDLRHRLLLEELDEFCNAYHANDLIEMADGLADMCYIIAGTCVSYGIAPEGNFGSPYEGVLKQLDLFEHAKLDLMLRDDFKLYENAEAANDLEAIREKMLCMMSVIFGVALHLGIPINAVFAEVHRSNMAKALPDGTVLYREDGKIMKPDGWTPPDIRSILEGIK